MPVRRRCCLLVCLAAAAAQGSRSDGAPGGDLEAHFQTRQVRITYSFAYRSILQGQVTASPEEDPYLLLAGNVEQLTPPSAARGQTTYDPAFGRRALFATTAAMLEHPQTVTAGVGRALMVAGVVQYLESYRVYRRWAGGETITAEERRRFRRGEGALDRIELGRTLVTEARGHAEAPPGWAAATAPLRAQLDELRASLAEADALEALEQMRPLIDRAIGILEDYPPYRRHRDQLRTWLADGTRAMSNAVARAHARVMAPGANMQRTNFYRGRGVRHFNEISWTHDAGDPVRGQPAVSYNTLYYAAAGRYRWDPLRVFAMDLPSRETKWRFEAPARRGYSVTIHGGRLYLACGDVGSTPSYICALDAATGTLRWVFEGPRGEDNMLSHPAADEGSVYVADRWGHLYAIDAITGDERWRFDAETGRRSTAPTPTLADGVVYLPSTHYVFAVEAANGKELWRLDAAVSEGVVAVEHDVMYFCDRGITAVSLADRGHLWTYAPGGAGPFRGGPAIAGGIVFGRGAGTLYAVDQAGGRLLWSFQSPKPFDWKVSPVVADGVVYIGTEGAQTSGDGDGAYLFAIDAATGTRLWQLQVETSLYGSPPVVADGVVYFSSGPELYAVH